jgi:signal transduction histidine kinase
MMLNLIKKRLTIMFTSVIVLVNILLMAIIFLYIHISLLTVCKGHIKEDIEKEFIPNYRMGGIERLAQIYDEDYLQVLNKKGDIVGGTRHSERFTTTADRELLIKAFSGETVFQLLKIGVDKHYLISYFPLDKNNSGRVVMQMTITRLFEYNFLKLILISFPGMLVLSYFISRLLVNYSMKPAVEVCEFQDNFMSNISHELRSPLASIRGNLEISLRKDRPVDEYKEVIETSLKETDRAIDLLKNMHLLSSSNLKPLELLKDHVDLKMILMEVLNSYKPQADSRGISFEVADISDVICICDESLIKRAIENLLDNSLKYTLERGVIKISISKDSANTYLTIKNKCRGLANEEIQYLFDPFYRGKSQSDKTIEGQGLGLYIARHIIRSHHGDITINITDDNVFSVTVSLPKQ